MSETITETTEEASAPAVDLFTEAGITSVLADAGDARVADVSSFIGYLTDFRDTLAGTFREAKRALNARKKAAERNANLRGFILTPTGPDWAGKTQAYRSIVESVMSEAFPVSSDFTKEDRNRELTAIRAHVGRTFLELAIRKYVRETVEGMPSEAEADTDAFRFAVKQEYLRCELTPPKAYLSPEERAGGGGSGSTPPNPAEAATQVVSGLGNLTPKYQALTLLAGISALADTINRGNAEGGVNDRDDTKAIVLRIQSVAQYCRKALDTKASPDDWKSLQSEGILFTEADARM